MGTAIAVNGLGGVRERPFLSWRGELLTVFLSTWTIAGAFLDGWVHAKFGRPDTFFTPWHAVFYSGYAALSVWVLWSVASFRRQGRNPWEAIPAGYEWGVLGLFIFLVGVVGDFLWHSVFGIEQAGERLASPAHLLLFIGGLLTVTSPLRAAWTTQEVKAPSLRRFLPGLLSLTLTTTVIAFMLWHLWGFDSVQWLGAAQYDQFRSQFTAAPQAARQLLFLAQARVAGAILVTNLVLLAPVLLMLRRWRVPFGSVTILFSVTAIFMAALREFWLVETVAIALLAGLAADILVRMLDPSPLRVFAYRIFATAVPFVVWSLYFIITHLRWGLTTSPELWVGGVFFTAVTGLTLSLLMVPARES